MALVTTRLKSSGMHCSSCSMLIDMTVGELDGIDAVKTDHATGLTVVTYDDGAVNIEDIMSAIRGAGYETELEA